MSAYEAKYLDQSGASFIIPANLSAAKMDEIRELAIRTFQVLCCEGLARVDFFLTESGQLFINEINTLPGFTNISMYPKMWEATGINYSTLIDWLVDLALERFLRDQELKVDR